jgi:uncharacterized membrane protein YdjX (TVP38/TMEM64 family)
MTNDPQRDDRQDTPATRPDGAAPALALSWRSLTIGVLTLALVLVPFMLWGDDLDRWATELLATSDGRLMLGATIVALLAADIALPIPASVLGLAGGAALGVLAGTLTVTLGLTIACLGGYCLGRVGGPPVLARFLVAHEREALERLAARHGVLALVLCRPLPVLGEASVILAGTARLPLLPVLLATTAANAGLGLAYAALGGLANDGRMLVLSFIASLAIPGLGWLLLRAVRRPSAAE